MSETTLPDAVEALRNLVYACRKVAEWDDNTRMGMALLEAEAALSAAQASDDSEGKLAGIAWIDANGPASPSRPVSRSTQETAEVLHSDRSRNART